MPTGPTRPGELGRAEAQRIAYETAEILKRISTDDDRAYREHVLVTLARMEIKVDTLKESLETHIADDDKRFTGVNQNINANSSWINKGVGITAAIVVMLGVFMWIIDKLHAK
jgi:hypothetical protein